MIYASIPKKNLSLFICPFEKTDVVCRGDVCLSVHLRFPNFFFWDINFKLDIHILHVAQQIKFEFNWNSTWIWMNGA